jgi:hypothetical protein
MMKIDTKKGNLWSAVPNYSHAGNCVFLFDQKMSHNENKEMYILGDLNCDMLMHCTALHCPALYNRLQECYADLFFTVNNIEQYYSS